MSRILAALRTPAFRLFVVATGIVAGIAISDALLYLAGGTRWTYTWLHHRAQVATYPIGPFLGGAAAMLLLCSRGRRGRRLRRLLLGWPIVAVWIGIIIGHLFWPLTIYLR